MIERNPLPRPTRRRRSSTMTPYGDVPDGRRLMVTMDFAAAPGRQQRRWQLKGLVVAEWGYGDDELFVMFVGEPAFVHDGDSSAMLLDNTVWIVNRATGAVMRKLPSPGSALSAQSRVSRCRRHSRA